MRIILSIILITFLSTSAMATLATKTPADNIKQLRSQITLGDVKFSAPSKNKLAQEHFQLGVSFLHAFMYKLAIVQFQAAQRLDPGFMLAYWGEAMSYKHPIWNFEDVDAARATLSRYAANTDGRKLSDKEQMYLHAVQRYFAKKTLRERNDDYVSHMQQFYQKYSDDPNIAAFYSLALLGRASDFASDSASKQDINKGRDLITAFYKRFPDHPGVVHYFLHYHDVTDKALAAKAMPAAKTALTMMSSSSHVAHMAAHIYRRLESWDEFIAANQQSIDAANTVCTMLEGKLDYRCNADNKYHSLEWLQYGYLKQGKHDEAHKAYQAMADIFKQDQSLAYKQWYYRMWARHVIANKQWREAAIEVDPISKQDGNLYWSGYTECAALLANDLLKTHQLQAIKPTLARLDKVIALTSTLTEPYINQTCRLAKLEILKADATVNKEKTQVKDLQSQIKKLNKERISTELTPSLSVLPGTM